MLFGVKAVDPLTISRAGIVMLAIGWIATFLPARRATSVDPAVILRDE